MTMVLGEVQSKTATSSSIVHASDGSVSFAIIRMKRKQSELSPVNKPAPKGHSERAALTHVDRRGRVRMVDIGDKPVTHREAVARAVVAMEAATLEAIVGGTLKKGEALAAARLAGIMAAKRTHELIPLCHQLPLQVVEVDFYPISERSELEIEARAVTDARTGVEMEALVAVSAAALTIYDMAKAIDRAMVIGAIRLVRKTGGRSGDFVRPGEPSVPRQANRIR
jgi:cyclic pyranopterin monophosphate synthase